jgi:hypothetical protein
MTSMPELPRTNGPTEEDGASLLRSDVGSEEFRARAERPSRVGRFVLVGLGGVIVGAGTGAWFARASPAAAVDGLLVFGLLLIVLGYAQHKLLLRDRDHWPKRAFLWGEGLELVLANDEIRAAPWSDPRFALDFYARPMPNGAPDEILLVWKMDRRIPMSLITQEGFDRVREAAVTHGLEFSEFRADSRRRTLRGFEIRPTSPSSVQVTTPADANQPAL